jgi:hypothetical protein
VTTTLIIETPTNFISCRVKDGQIVIAFLCRKGTGWIFAHPLAVWEAAA